MSKGIAFRRNNCLPSTTQDDALALPIFTGWGSHPMNGTAAGTSEQIIRVSVPDEVARCSCTVFPPDLKGLFSTMRPSSCNAAPKSAVGKDIRDSRAVCCETCTYAKSCRLLNLSTSSAFLRQRSLRKSGEFFLFALKADRFDPAAHPKSRLWFFQSGDSQKDSQAGISYPALKFKKWADCFRAPVRARTFPVDLFNVFIRAGNLNPPL